MAIIGRDTFNVADLAELRNLAVESAPSPSVWLPRIGKRRRNLGAETHNGFGFGVSFSWCLNDYAAWPVAGELSLDARRSGSSFDTFGLVFHADEFDAAVFSEEPHFHDAVYMRFGFPTSSDLLIFFTQFYDLGPPTHLTGVYSETLYSGTLATAPGDLLPRLGVTKTASTLQVWKEPPGGGLRTVLGSPSYNVTNSIYPYAGFFHAIPSNTAPFGRVVGWNYADPSPTDGQIWPRSAGAGGGGVTGQLWPRFL